MKRKCLNVMSIYFDEKDTATMRQSFNGENFLSLKGAANSEDEALDMYFEFMPPIIAINIVDDLDNGIYTIRAICDVAENKLPFFIVGLSTDETDVLKDPYMKVISKIGVPLSRYGDTHNVNDIINFAQYISEFTTDISELGQIVIPDEIFNVLSLTERASVYISIEDRRVVLRNFNSNNRNIVYERKVDEFHRIVLPTHIRKFLKLSGSNDTVSLASHYDKVIISRGEITRFPICG